VPFGFWLRTGPGVAVRFVKRGRHGSAAPAVQAHEGVFDGVADSERGPCLGAPLMPGMEAVSVSLAGFG